MKFLWFWSRESYTFNRQKRSGCVSLVRGWYSVGMHAASTVWMRSGYLIVCMDLFFLSCAAKCCCSGRKPKISQVGGRSGGRVKTVLNKPPDQGSIILVGV